MTFAFSFDNSTWKTPQNNNAASASTNAPAPATSNNNPFANVFLAPTTSPPAAQAPGSFNAPSMASIIANIQRGKIKISIINGTSPSEQVSALVLDATNGNPPGQMAVRLNGVGQFAKAESVAAHVFQETFGTTNKRQPFQSGFWEGNTLPGNATKLTVHTLPPAMTAPLSSIDLGALKSFHSILLEEIQKYGNYPTVSIPFMDLVTDPATLQPIADAVVQAIVAWADQQQTTPVPRTIFLCSGFDPNKAKALSTAASRIPSGVSPTMPSVASTSGSAASAPVAPASVPNFSTSASSSFFAPLSGNAGTTAPSQATFVSQAPLLGGCYWLDCESEAVATRCPKQRVCFITAHESSLVSSIKLLEGPRSGIANTRLKPVNEDYCEFLLGKRPIEFKASHGRSIQLAVDSTGNNFLPPTVGVGKRAFVLPATGTEIKSNDVIGLAKLKPLEDEEAEANRDLSAEVNNDVHIVFVAPATSHEQYDAKLGECIVNSLKVVHGEFREKTHVSILFAPPVFDGCIPFRMSRIMLKALNDFLQKYGKKPAFKIETVTVCAPDRLHGAVLLDACCDLKNSPLSVEERRRLADDEDQTQGTEHNSEEKQRLEQLLVEKKINFEELPLAVIFKQVKDCVRTACGCDWANLDKLGVPTELGIYQVLREKMVAGYFLHNQELLSSKTTWKDVKANFELGGVLESSKKSPVGRVVDWRRAMNLALTGTEKGEDTDS